MKKANFTVEFTSPCLSNIITDTMDVFQRDSTGKLLFQQKWWHSALQAGFKYVADDDIRAALRGVTANDINILTRVDADVKNYERMFQGTEPGSRIHESIPVGAVVEFSALVEDHVTTEGLRGLLEAVGEFVGISPYGHARGYGKFVVQEVNIEGE